MEMRIPKSTRTFPTILIWKPKIFGFTVKSKRFRKQNSPGNNESTKNFS
jgi:hypothetical protein